jgi:hypothetical protein
VSGTEDRQDHRGQSRQGAFRDGSHKDNFGESLETLLAGESQTWVSFRS